MANRVKVRTNITFRRMRSNGTLANGMQERHMTPTVIQQAPYLASRFHFDAITQ